MDRALDELSVALLSELEKKYFWWEEDGGQPRNENRILAQAMDQCGFDEIRRLETVIGRDRLVDVMMTAQPGWLSDRSWELWRGRLSLASGRKLPEEPPRRALHAAAL